MRNSKIITLTETATFKSNLFHWAQQFEEIAWLDSNTEFQISKQNYADFDMVLAVGAESNCRSRDLESVLGNAQDTTFHNTLFYRNLFII